VGFDYRLAMGVPDYWIKLLKHVRDEDWNVAEIWRELSSRRAEERTIGYCESHDQALVGDKSSMFWLADKEMYWHMRVDDQNLVIDRAIALHKIIRLLTFGTSGNGYLTFIGNEFGHPEWVDFPRQGNDWSPSLKYRFLAEFDRAMVSLASATRLLEQPWAYKHYEHVADKVLVFSRAGLVFAFNFDPNRSYDGYELFINPGRYGLALTSDAAEFISGVEFPVDGGRTV